MTPKIERKRNKTIVIVIKYIIHECLEMKLISNNRIMT